MSVSEVAPCLQLSDETLTDARRVRDMLASVGSLLVHPLRESAIMAARGTALEAAAVCGLMLDRLERFFAWQHEQERHAHSQAKHVAPSLGGAR
jgi:hypothetical protein